MPVLGPHVSCDKGAAGCAAPQGWATAAHSTFGEFSATITTRTKPANRVRTVVVPSLVNKRICNFFLESPLPPTQESHPNTQKTVANKRGKTNPAFSYPQQALAISPASTTTASLPQATKRRARHHHHHHTAPNTAKAKSTNEPFGTSRQSPSRTPAPLPLR